MIKMSAVAEELLRIAQQDPETILRKERVVEAAKPKDSVLHTHFTWDNSVAGQKYREEVEAPKLIRLVRVEEPKSKQVVPMFISLPSDRLNPGGGYRNIQDVLQQPTLMQELLRGAIADLKSFQSRYESLEELAEVFGAISKVVKEYTE